jgi:hypothetical protein
MAMQGRDVTEGPDAGDLARLAACADNSAFHEAPQLQ